MLKLTVSVDGFYFECHVKLLNISSDHIAVARHLTTQLLNTSSIN